MITAAEGVVPHMLARRWSSGWARTGLRNSVSDAGGRRCIGGIRHGLGGRGGSLVAAGARARAERGETADAGEKGSRISNRGAPSGRRKLQVHSGEELLKLPPGWRDANLTALRRLCKELQIDVPSVGSKDDLIVRLTEAERLGKEVWDMSVAEMQKELKDAGLTSGGKKSEIWSRLLNHKLRHIPWNPAKYEELVRLGKLPPVVRPAAVLEPPTYLEWKENYFDPKFHHANFESSRSEKLLDANRYRRVLTPAVLDAVKLGYSWAGHRVEDASDFKSIWPEHQRKDFSLRAFQESGVDYLLRARACFLADEMGLGKTAQALTAVRIAGTYPCIIVCPASLKLNWSREIEMWTPEATVEILDGVRPVFNRELRPPSDITIVNYDILPHRIGELLKFEPKGLVLDECHRIKSPDALATKSVALLAEAVHGMATGIDWRPSSKNSRSARSPIPSDARPSWETSRPKLKDKMDYLVLMVSGTPMLSCPYDLFTQLSCMGRLRMLWPDGHDQYVRRHCGKPRPVFQFQRQYRGGAREMEYKGNANLPELHQRLRSTAMVRRLKQDVLAQLPQKMRQTFLVAMAPEVEKTYSSMVSTFEDDADYFAKAAEGDRLEAQTQVKISLAALRMFIGKAKVATVVEQIEQFFEEADASSYEDEGPVRGRPKKLLVFAWHIDVVNEIKDSLNTRYGSKTFTGQTPAAEKDRVVAQFQNDDSVRVLICNIKAGGVGITLTRASDVFFAEETYTPAEIAQAEDRVHRIGQTNNVEIRTFLLAKTMDETVHRIIAEKRRVIEATLEGTSLEDVEEHRISIESELINMAAKKSKGVAGGKRDK